MWFNKPNNKNTLLKDDLGFKNSENILTFNYTTLNFISPEKDSYQYKCMDLIINRDL